MQPGSTANGVPHHGNGAMNNINVGAGRDLGSDVLGMEVRNAPMATSPVNNKKILQIDSTSTEQRLSSLCFRPLDWWPWICSWLLPGLGMFTESYFIFSTGQIKSIWKVAYPTCWAPHGKASCSNLIACNGNYANTPVGFVPPDPASCNAQGNYDICAKSLIDAISYIEFAGIMAGMLGMGFIAYRLGLKWSSVTTISIMGVGAILMTASSGPSLTGLFTMFAVAYLIFGYGVGGEYPTAAVGAAERHAEHTVRTGENGGVPNTRHMFKAAQRGRAVQMMFSMQGWGAVVGAAIICIVLAGFDARSPVCNAGNNPQGYRTHDLQATWRILYGLGLIPIIYTLMYRIFVVKEPRDRAAMMAANKDARMHDPDYVPFSRSLALFMWHYWSRLSGTALSWFVWDVAFYGNKLFSGPIFSALLGPGTHLLDTNLYILLNNSVALVGYWFAAYTIDKAWMGRVRLQVMGFLFTGALFIASAAKWDTLNVHVRLFLYIFSSFWGQFGPNATTYVLPSESFPSEVRTVGHGISAFSGKAGALVATIVFTRLEIRTVFWVTGGCCMTGAVITVILCTNLRNLDFIDQEEHWRYIKEGRVKEYTGEAIRPQNLSWFERYIQRQGRNYQKPQQFHDLTNGMAGQQPPKAVS